MGEDWPKNESENAIRRRCYVLARMKKSDFKKLRRWRGRHDCLEIATDDETGEVLILNQTKVNGTERNRRLFMGKPDED